MSADKKRNRKQYFQCIEPKLLSYKQQVYHRSSHYVYSDQMENDSKDTIDFDIKLISYPPKHPVVFQIDNILSHIECDAAIKLIESKMESMNNKIAKEKRNGPQFCRLYRQDNVPLFSNIFGRIGDILDIDEKLLNIFCASYYKQGTKMIGHYDQCNCTLIIYLNDLKHDQGGKTIFPKANLALHPGKGNSILFYTKKYNLKDVDPLSYHLGENLSFGEKYLLMLQW